MPRPSVLAQRASAVSGWSVPLTTALLAADASSPTGFRPRDVRFYFLLFTNWMGDDHLRPGADLDPTQVRRVLQLLAGEGACTEQGGRPPCWSLTPAGVVRLVEAITDPNVQRRFEEVILLSAVAASYVDAVAVRLGGPEARRVRARLDRRAILRAERARLSTALLDLEARQQAGPAIGAAGRAALARGLDVVSASAEVERSGAPYQLHPMRPFHEVVEALPPDMARYELTRGPEERSRWIFAPLAEELRARIAILDRLVG